MRNDSPRSELVLGRVLGVRVALHYSWFLIAGLMLLSLAPMFRRWAPQMPAGTALLCAAGTVLLFFTGLLVHELAHALVARRFGVPVQGITLFALGGVAKAGGESPRPAVEFWIGIVGPLTSAALGGACLALARLWGPLGPAPASLAQGALAWLGAINLAIAAFNLIPAYPLDGGRVLRAALWSWTGSLATATRAAARAGQFLALLMIAWGALRFMTGAGLAGLWLAFIGWFLLDSASMSYLDVDVRRVLSGLKVGDLMSRDVATAPAGERLDEAADMFLRTGRRCLVLREDGHWAGMLTPRDVSRVPPARRHGTMLRAAAHAASTLPPGASALEALELMAREEVEQLPVVEGGDVAGLLSREDILHALQTRRELAPER